MAEFKEHDPQGPEAKTETTNDIASEPNFDPTVLRTPFLDSLVIDLGDFDLGLSQAEIDAYLQGREARDEPVIESPQSPAQETVSADEDINESLPQLADAIEVSWPYTPAEVRAVLTTYHIKTALGKIEPLDQLPDRELTRKAADAMAVLEPVIDASVEAGYWKGLDQNDLVRQFLGLDSQITQPEIFQLTDQWLVDGDSNRLEEEAPKILVPVMLEHYRKTGDKDFNLQLRVQGLTHKLPSTLKNLIDTGLLQTIESEDKKLLVPTEDLISALEIDPRNENIIAALTRFVRNSLPDEVFADLGLAEAPEDLVREVFDSVQASGQIYHPTKLNKPT